MGLKDKMLKKSSEITNQRPTFTPLELSEGNIQAIFNRCLATDETNEYIESILQQTIHGYANDSNPILFDKQKLLENLKKIRYLYGQLKTAHNDTNTINTNADSKNNVMTDYSGKTWTKNKRYTNAIVSFRGWI